MALVKVSTLTFAEESAWKQQILDESVAWAKEVLGVKGADLVSAYKAGLDQGMSKIISTLSIQGKVVRQ